MDLDIKLTEKLSWSIAELSLFSLNAPNKYKIYSIPKRTSGKRTIAHPSKKLKLLQRLLAEELKKTLPIHHNAYAYIKGRGIKNNAISHLRGRYLLKLDFSNFFHSITPDIFFNLLIKRSIVISKRDQHLLQQLLFCNMSKKKSGKLVLSIGAPSSPFISNAIMYFFDEALTKYCEERAIVYSRYADDLTFSTKFKKILFDVPSVVNELLLDIFSGQILLNSSKTVFSSRAHNRHVTGITLTNDEKLSIGRSRKRYISSLVHRYSLGVLPEEDHSYLQGLLSFAFDVEPEFKPRLIKKYSVEIINLLMGSQ